MTYNFDTGAMLMFQRMSGYMEAGKHKIVSVNICNYSLCQILMLQKSMPKNVQYLSVADATTACNEALYAALSLVLNPLTGFDMLLGILIYSTQ